MLSKGGRYCRGLAVHLLQKNEVRVREQSTKDHHIVAGVASFWQLRAKD